MIRLQIGVDFRLHGGLYNEYVIFEVIVFGVLHLVSNITYVLYG